jgi:hypothetical protein
MIVRVCIATLATCFVLDCCYAKPLFASAEVISEHLVYRDSEKANKYYYLPEPIVIAETDDGRPDLSLLLTRYVGTAHQGDQGEWINRNLLTVRFRMKQTEKSDINAIKATLRSRGIRNAKVDSLPLYAVAASIQYTPIDSETSIGLSGSGFATSDEADARAVANWRERAYLLSLGENDAELLVDALEQGQVLISFSYAYLARFDSRDEADFNVTGAEELVEGLAEQVAEIVPKTASNIAAAYSDAIALVLDPTVAEQHITKLDINESMPPGYAVLDIYCFDFQQDIIPGQYAKRVEIKATSPTGKTFTTALAFTNGDPEVYGQRLRVPYAVDFKRPYRYRVISVMKTGQQEEVTPWTERTRWAEVLDITEYQ